MIKEYFLQVEKILQEFPIIRSYALNKKVYNNHQGLIGGRIVFENESSLEFLEVVDTEQENKLKYRYHYMDTSQNLIFRYDNAPHYPQVDSFPHHKHVGERVQASAEPKLRDILFEVARQI